MSKHTEGPWHVFSVYAQHEVRTPTGSIVAVVNSQQDSRLVSAAPDMLAALQMLYAEIADYSRINNLGGMDNQCMRMARAALAKAVGAV